MATSEKGVRITARNGWTVVATRSYGKENNALGWVLEQEFTALETYYNNFQTTNSKEKSYQNPLASAGLRCLHTPC